MKGYDSIGTVNESALHRALKIRYAGEESRTEMVLEGFICDGLRANGEIIEVQTGNFCKVEKKLRKLAALRPIRLVYPIITEKYIELFDETGTLLSRKKSPKKGCIWDIFRPLIYAPNLPAIPGLVVELAPVVAAEQRIRNGKGSWHRHGDSISGLEALDFREAIPLAFPQDYDRFVPFPPNQLFTVRNLAIAAHIRSNLAQKTLYVLVKLGIVARLYKEGRTYIYTLVSPKKAYQESTGSSSSRLFSAKRSVSTRRSSK
ncbi:MAG: hypothetical protein LBT11_03340 [Treponema sp.]|nr:hypothetical protein [Treponema sp.]